MQEVAARYSDTLQSYRVISTQLRQTPAYRSGESQIQKVGGFLNAFR